MIKKLLKIFSVFIIIVIILVAVIYLSLLPPHLDVPEQGNITIANVNIINPGKKVLQNHTIVVKSHKIVSIYASKEGEKTSDILKIPPGSWIFPGLIDSHVHFPPDTAIGNQELFALLFLSSGITTVRDMGVTDSGSLFTTIKRINNGEIPGPRIITPGQILDGENSMQSFARIVTDPDDAGKAVDEQVARGASFIKVYTNLSLLVYRAIYEAAQKRGLRVVGHLPIRVPIAGSKIGDINHSEEVFTLPVDVDLRDSLIGAKVRMEVWEKTTQKEIRHVVETSKKESIHHVPTLISYRRIYFIDTYDSEINKPDYAFLPRFWREIVWNPNEGSRSVEKKIKFSRWNDYIKRKYDLMRNMHEAGVQIFAGTDTPNPLVMPGVSLYQELLELQKIGMTVIESLEAATVKPGIYLFNDGTGLVQEKGPADFIVLKANPVKDISRLKEIVGVMANGRYYPSEYLDKSLVKYRDHFNSWLYDLATFYPAKILSKLY
jgi:imidazolonepropionase-like amidohydrolase